MPRCQTCLSNLKSPHLKLTLESKQNLLMGEYCNYHCLLKGVTLIIQREHGKDAAKKVVEELHSLIELNGSSSCQMAKGKCNCD